MTSHSGLLEQLGHLASAPRLLVCCDFDGTLSHLVDDPREARPVVGAVEIMEALGGLPGTQAALVSGRSLHQLAAVAGMPPHVGLVGSHGTEFRAGEIPGLGSQERELLERTAHECEVIVADAPGAFVESKPASVAVHVRRAEPDARTRVLDAVRAGPAQHPSVHVTEGKDVIEIAVVRTGKGAAIDALRRTDDGARAVVLFAGDDVTDEDGFASLLPGDVGIKVGEGESIARFRVEDPGELIAMLKVLLDLRGRLRA